LCPQWPYIRQCQHKKQLKGSIKKQNNKWGEKETTKNEHKVWKDKFPLDITVVVKLIDKLQVFMAYRESIIFYNN
jgi:hypothetical protein